MSFAKEVWDNLYKIDVKKLTQKKGKFDYLPWAKAWLIIMENYPESTYEFKEPVYIGNGTCELWCAITIREEEKSLKREMWLPVMDHTNKSKIDPTTRDLSDARMRCLVKCLSLFGLGLYIYEGEDVPTKISNYTDEEKAQFYALLNSGQSFTFYAYTNLLTEEAYNDLYNSADQGEKVKFKASCDSMTSKGVQQWLQFEEDISELVDNDKKEQLRHFLKENELNKIDKLYMKQRMGVHFTNKIADMIKDNT